MARWVLGAQMIEALDGRGIAAGARTSLVVQIGRLGHAYLGEIIDATESRLVRRYHLERVKTGVLAPLAKDNTGYDYRYVRCWPLLAGVAGVTVARPASGGSVQAGGRDSIPRVQSWWRLAVARWLPGPAWSVALTT